MDITGQCVMWEIKGLRTYLQYSGYVVAIKIRYRAVVGSNKLVKLAEQNR